MLYILCFPFHLAGFWSAGPATGQEIPKDLLTALLYTDRKIHLVPFSGNRSSTRKPRVHLISGRRVPVVMDGREEAHRNIHYCTVSQRWMHNILMMYGRCVAMKTEIGRGRTCCKIYTWYKVCTWYCCIRWLDVGTHVNRLFVYGVVWLKARTCREGLFMLGSHP